MEKAGILAEMTEDSLSHREPKPVCPPAGQPPAMTHGMPHGTSFVSRGGLKLAHALSKFGFSPRGLLAADLGCSTGGFTDCLLQAGARHVYCIDTGYGVLAYKLRQDARTTVLERQNALHVERPPSLPAGSGVDLVVMDLGWTRQNLAIPAALRWFASGAGVPARHIITLVKPHYELGPDEKHLLSKGVLADADAQRISERTLEAIDGQLISGYRLRIAQQTASPIRGSNARKPGAGNIEWLALIIAEFAGD